MDIRKPTQGDVVAKWQLQDSNPGTFPNPSSNPSPLGEGVLKFSIAEITGAAFTPAPLCWL